MASKESGGRVVLGGGDARPFDAQDATKGSECIYEREWKVEWTRKESVVCTRRESATEGQRYATSV